MKEIDVFKAKIRDIRKFMTETINYDCNRILTGLDFKEKIIVEGVRLTETKLKRQNVLKRIIDTIKNY